MLRTATEQQKKRATYLAFISIPLSGFVTDIYLPSFPAMAKEMLVSEKDVQLTLTCYLLSYGISQLFIGSILDTIGRYRPKLMALAMVILTSLLITQTNSILFICMLRIMQGISISVLVVATRALFVDLYEGERLKHYLSYFTITWSLGPILAPFIGGYLEKLFNWHSNFYFLAVYAGILFVAEWVFSGESIEKKGKLNLAENIGLYKTMLQNNLFMLGILILGFSYSIVMLFNLTGPFIIENTFHYNSVTIGYCTLILGFSWMIGGMIGKKRMHLDFVRRIIYPVVLQLGLIILFLIISRSYANLTLLIGFAFFIHICSGILFTSFFTSSMLYFPKNAGTAGGLMGGLVYVITSLTSFAVSSSGLVSLQVDLALRYLVFSLVLFGVILWMYSYLKRERKIQVTE